MCIPRLSDTVLASTAPSLCCCSRCRATIVLGGLSWLAFLAVGCFVDVFCVVVGGVSVGVTSDSTVDDVERSDDVDEGVSCFTTVVAVAATGLRSADCARLLLLFAEYPGNLVALRRLTCSTPGNTKWHSCPVCNWTTKFRSRRTSHMEPSATSTTVTGPVGQRLQAGAEDAPVLDRPAPSRCLHDFDAAYKYPDSLTYVLTTVGVVTFTIFCS